MEILYQNFANITYQQVIMWIIGGVLIFLAIKKEMEPTLLLPMISLPTESLSAEL